MFQCLDYTRLSFLDNTKRTKIRRLNQSSEYVETSAQLPGENETLPIMFQGAYKAFAQTNNAIDTHYQLSFTKTNNKNKNNTIDDIGVH